MSWVVVVQTEGADSEALYVVGPFDDLDSAEKAATKLDNPDESEYADVVPLMSP